MNYLNSNINYIKKVINIYLLTYIYMYNIDIYSNIYLNLNIHILNFLFYEIKNLILLNHVIFKNNDIHIYIKSTLKMKMIFFFLKFRLNYKFN